MKKILITNAFGPQNRGDHELLQKLIKILKEKHGEDCIIKVFTTYPKESNTAIPEALFYRSPFYKPKSFYELILMAWDITFWTAASILTSRLKILLSKERRERFSEIIESDLIAMCPGGYLYSNGLSLYVNLINCLPFRKSKAFKVASPMSIGPFTSKIDSWACTKQLKTLDEIHTRESYSFDLTSKMGLNPTYTHDLAWYKERNLAIDNSWSGHFVGTVIDWNYPGKDSETDYRERYISEYLKAAYILADHSGKPFILFNQVGSGDGASKDEILIAEIVSRSSGRVIFDSTSCTPSILKSRLSGCRGILASRFHSCLFAIQANTPFIAIAYQPKATFILKDLHLHDLCREIESFDGAELASSLLAWEKNRPSLVDRLSKAKELTTLSIEKNFLCSLRPL